MSLTSPVMTNKRSEIPEHSNLTFKVCFFSVSSANKKNTTKHLTTIRHTEK